MSDTLKRPYYIDASMVGHDCCWDSAIVRKCDHWQGLYPHGVELVCECRAENAPAICAALNAALESQA